MLRGMPFSILVHVLAIVVVFVFGNRVNRPPVQLPHTLDLEIVMVSPPVEDVVEQVEPEPPTPTKEPEVEEEPAVVPEKPKDIPEEIIPEEKPELEEKPVKEPSNDPKEAEPADLDPEPEPPKPALTGFGVSGTDVDFPFSYYLGIVQTRISRHYNPARLGFRDNAVISCVLHFNIARNGSISQVTVERSSGIDVFDREARRAVLAAHPLPKLPAKYSSSSLGITFVFNLESGI